MISKMWKLNYGDVMEYEELKIVMMTHVCSIQTAKAGQGIPAGSRREIICCHLLYWFIATNKKTDEQQRINLEKTQLLLPLQPFSPKVSAQKCHIIRTKKLPSNGLARQLCWRAPPVLPLTQRGWLGWTTAAFHHLSQSGSPEEKEKNRLNWREEEKD